jgi:hypothetical protein
MPAEPPSPRLLAERDHWAEHANSSLSRVRGSAQTWRTGLAAFLTLVTTGVMIKGRDTTADLTTSWRTAITLLIGGGLLLAVIGLWRALAAEAGTHPRPATLQAIRDQHGTLTAHEVHLASRAARQLAWGKLAVAAAVLFLLAGLCLTWWAPTAPPTPPAYVSVEHADTITCGILLSADGGSLRLTVPGTHAPAVIPMGSITNLAVVTQCP